MGALNVAHGADGTVSIRLRWLGGRIMMPLVTAVVFSVLDLKVLPFIDQGGGLLVVGLVFTGFAVVGWYMTLAYLVNRTRIEVGGAVLSIRHGPLPSGPFILKPVARSLKPSSTSRNVASGLVSNCEPQRCASTPARRVPQLRP